MTTETRDHPGHIARVQALGLVVEAPQELLERERPNGREKVVTCALHPAKSDAQLDLGAVGGRRRRRAFAGATQQEVIDKIATAKRELHEGLNSRGREEALGRFVKRWLEQRDPRTPAAGIRKLRWNTWMGYESRMRRHVLPVLGATPLGKLTPEHVRGLLAEMGGSSLCATTVAVVRDTLGTILQRAVKDRVIPYNPVKAVDSVARAKPRTYVVSADEARAFLHAAEGHPFEGIVVLALQAGLRESEILGVKWEDMELDRAALAVRRTLVRVPGAGLVDSPPKTRASAATIPLTSRAVEALRSQRRRQLEQRIRAGSGWQETGYVFTTEIGTPISASNMLRRVFYPLAAAAGLPTRRQADGSLGVRFHDLRHGCGSLLVQMGVKPKVVQAILRHAKLSTTMDLYVHAYDEDLREAVKSLETALG